MILIITGASHTGKTLLAQRMLERRHWPYLSLDHLKMGLIRSGNTALTPEDDDALTEYLWPIAAEIIKTAVENRQNLTVEGCYVPSDWRRSFTAEYLREIRLVCLTMTERYIRAHIDDIAAHASVIEARLEDGWWTADELIAENARYAVDFGSDCFVIDGEYGVEPDKVLRME